jgi:hypothetical protein
MSLGKRDEPIAGNFARQAVVTVPDPRGRR